MNNHDEQHNKIYRYHRMENKKQSKNIEYIPLKRNDQRLEATSLLIKPFLYT